MVQSLAAIAGVVNTGNAEAFLGSLFYFVVFVLALLFVSGFVAMVAQVGVRFVQNSSQSPFILKTLRNVATISSSVLFIPALGVLFRWMRCDGLSEQLPDGSCWTGIHAAIGFLVLLLSPVFIALSVFTQTVFIDRNPLSDMLGAKIHGRVETFMILAKVALVLVFTALLEVIPAVVTLLLCITVSVLWVYLLGTQQPFIVGQMNDLRTGFGAVFGWITLMAAFVLASPSSDFGILTLMGIIPCFGLGWYFSKVYRETVVAMRPADLKKWQHSELWSRARVQLRKQLAEEALRQGTGRLDPGSSAGGSSSVGGTHFGSTVLGSVLNGGGAGVGGSLLGTAAQYMGARNHTGGTVLGAGRRAGGTVIGRGGSSSGLGMSSTVLSGKQGNASLMYHAGRSVGSGAHQSTAGAGTVLQAAGQGGRPTSTANSALTALATLLRQAEDAQLRALRTYQGEGMGMVSTAAFFQVLHNTRYLELTALLSAKAASTALDVRFFVYQRTRQMREESDAGGERLSSVRSGSSKRSLSAIERVLFDQHWSSAREGELACYRAMLRVWQILSDPVPDLNQLQRIGTQMKRSLAETQTSFRAMLKINADNSKLQRSYGSFLLNLLRNPALASQFLNKAEALEQSQRSHKTRAVEHLTMFKPADAISATDDSVAVFTVEGAPHSIGRLSKVNAAACRMYGAPRSDMLGRNMNILLPPPIRAVHNSYLKRFTVTGKGCLVNRTFFSLYTDVSGYAQACRVSIAEAPPDEEDTAPKFSGMLQQVETPEHYLVFGDKDTDYRMLAGSRDTLALFGLQPKDLGNVHSNGPGGQAAGVSACQYFEEVDPAFSRKLNGETEADPNSVTPVGQAWHHTHRPSAVPATPVLNLPKNDDAGAGGQPSGVDLPVSAAKGAGRGAGAVVAVDQKSRPTGLGQDRKAKLLKLRTQSAMLTGSAGASVSLGTGSRAQAAGTSSLNAPDGFTSSLDIPRRLLGKPGPVSPASRLGAGRGRGAGPRLGLRSRSNVLRGAEAAPSSLVAKGGDTLLVRPRRGPKLGLRTASAAFGKPGTAGIPRYTFASRANVNAGASLLSAGGDSAVDGDGRPAVSMTGKMARVSKRFDSRAGLPGPFNMSVTDVYSQLQARSNTRHVAMLSLLRSGSEFRPTPVRRATDSSIKQVQAVVQRITLPLAGTFYLLSWKHMPDFERALARAAAQSSPGSASNRSSPSQTGGGPPPPKLLQRQGSHDVSDSPTPHARRRGSLLEQSAAPLGATLSRSVLLIRGDGSASDSDGGATAHSVRTGKPPRRVASRSHSHEKSGGNGSTRRGSLGMVGSRRHASTGGSDPGEGGSSGGNSQPLNESQRLLQADSFQMSDNECATMEGTGRGGHDDSRGAAAQNPHLRRTSSAGTTGHLHIDSFSGSQHLQGTQSALQGHDADGGAAASVKRLSAHRPAPMLVQVQEEQPRTGVPGDDVVEDGFPSSDVPGGMSPVALPQDDEGGLQGLLPPAGAEGEGEQGPAGMTAGGMALRRKSYGKRILESQLAVISESRGDASARESTAPRPSLQILGEAGGSNGAVSPEGSASPKGGGVHMQWSDCGDSVRRQAGLAGMPAGSSSANQSSITLDGEKLSKTLSTTADIDHTAAAGAILPGSVRTAASEAETAPARGASQSAPSPGPAAAGREDDSRQPLPLSRKSVSFIAAQEADLLGLQDGASEAVPPPDSKQQARSTGGSGKRSMPPGMDSKASMSMSDLGGGTSPSRRFSASRPRLSTSSGMLGSSGTGTSASPDGKARRVSGSTSRADVTTRFLAPSHASIASIGSGGTGAGGGRPPAGLSPPSQRSNSFQPRVPSRLSVGSSVGDHSLASDSVAHTPFATGRGSSWGGGTEVQTVNSGGLGVDVKSANEAQMTAVRVIRRIIESNLSFEQKELAWTNWAACFGVFIVFLIAATLPPIMNGRHVVFERVGTDVGFFGDAAVVAATSTTLAQSLDPRSNLFRYAATDDAAVSVLLTSGATAEQVIAATPELQVAPSLFRQQVQLFHVAGEHMESISKYLAAQDARKLLTRTVTVPTSGGDSSFLVTQSMQFLLSCLIDTAGAVRSNGLDLQELGKLGRSTESIISPQIFEQQKLLVDAIFVLFQEWTVVLLATVVLGAGVAIAVVGVAVGRAHSVLASRRRSLLALFTTIPYGKVAALREDAGLKLSWCQQQQRSAAGEEATDEAGWGLQQGDDEDDMLERISYGRDTLAAFSGARAMARGASSTGAAARRFSSWGTEDSGEQGPSGRRTRDPVQAERQLSNASDRGKRVTAAARGSPVPVGRRDSDGAGSYTRRPRGGSGATRRHSAMLAPNRFESVAAVGTRPARARSDVSVEAPFTPGADPPAGGGRRPLQLGTPDGGGYASSTEEHSSRKAPKSDRGSSWDSGRVRRAPSHSSAPPTGRASVRSGTEALLDDAPTSPAQETAHVKREYSFTSSVRRRLCYGFSMAGIILLCILITSAIGLTNTSFMPNHFNRMFITARMQHSSASIWSNMFRMLPTRSEDLLSPAEARALLDETAELQLLLSSDMTLLLHGSGTAAGPVHDTPLVEIDIDSEAYAVLLDDACTASASDELYSAPACRTFADDSFAQGLVAVSTYYSALTADITTTLSRAVAATRTGSDLVPFNATVYLQADAGSRGTTNRQRVRTLLQLDQPYFRGVLRRLNRLFLNDFQARLAAYRTAFRVTLWVQFVLCLVAALTTIVPVARRASSEVNDARVLLMAFPDGVAAGIPAAHTAMKDISALYTAAVSGASASSSRGAAGPAGAAVDGAAKGEEVAGVELSPTAAGKRGPPRPAAMRNEGKALRPNKGGL